MERDNIKHDWSVEDYEEYCREKVRRSQKKRRDRARENGFCTICCLRPARAGRVTCEECSTRIGNKAYIRRMEYKKQGLCPYCGKVPPEDGRPMCAECTEKRKRR